VAVRKALDVIVADPSAPDPTPGIRGPGP
jgi:hypothetical protein